MISGMSNNTKEHLPTKDGGSSCDSNGRGDELNKRESTKLTLRTIKSGDPSAWAPIAANDEMSSESPSEKLRREIQHLAFYNPGPSTKDLLGFKPELSNREKRKLNRLIDDKSGTSLSGDEEGKNLRTRRKSKQNTLYDSEGRLNDTGEDLCDCMILDCSGCHFECPRCGSEKCGSTCRSNRKWTYDVVCYDTK